MVYEKQTWQSGDIITAEKLNHMEDGINEAVFNESSLPVAESLGSGDKLRIVTSDGASKQIGADSVGAFVIHLAQKPDPSSSTGLTWYKDKTHAEIQAYLTAGGVNVILQVDESNGTGNTMRNYYLSQYSRSTNVLFFTCIEANGNDAVTRIVAHMVVITPDDEITVVTPKQFSAS